MMNIDPKSLIPDKTPMMASGYVKRIEKHLSEFIDDLKDDETFLLNVVLNDGSKIFPHFFRYHNPNMVIVEGHDANGNDTMVLLNQNDIQIIITKLKKSDATENSENIAFPDMYQ